MLAAWIDGVDRHRRRRVFLQQGNQAPCPHIGPDNESRLEDDAGAAHRGLREEVAVVGVQRAGYPHRALASLGILEAPHIARRDVLVREAIVRSQILGRLGSGMRRKVQRRGARHEASLAQLARHQVTGACGADPHRQVEALLDQIHHAVGELHVEAHLLVLREEIGDGGREMAHAEVHRSCQPDRAARHDGGAARFLLGLLQVGEELHRALIEGLTALGEADAPRGAIEEPRLQVRLEVGDVARGGGSGQAELAGSLGKAPRFNDLRENLDSAEPIHYLSSWDNLFRCDYFIP